MPAPVTVLTVLAPTNEAGVRLYGRDSDGRYPLGPPLDHDEARRLSDLLEDGARTSPVVRLVYNGCKVAMNRRCARTLAVRLREAAEQLEDGAQPVSGFVNVIPLGGRR